MRVSKKIIFLLLFFWILLPQGLPGYSTPNVPIDDPVYRDIDKLIAAGLVKDVIYGQRPWSRREIARIIGVALKNHQGQDMRILERLKKGFREELMDLGAIEGEKEPVRIHPLEEVRFDYTLLDSPFRPVPVQNGLGQIDAVINPLVAYKEGRHFVDGNTLGIETAHSAKLSKYFSLYFSPRLEILVPNTGPTDVNPLVQQVYGKLAYKNFEVEAGRDPLIWGHGRYGGAMFSNNARPLDMIKITSVSPFYHPWIFRHLGPSKYTFFVANLGPEEKFPWSFLYGLNASIKPFSFLELGFTHAITVGGQGAPKVKWYDPIQEFFFLRGGTLSGVGSPNVADHRLGINWRLYIPPLRNAQWYFETISEDIGKKTISVNFTQWMGFTTGVYFPLLTNDGKTDLEVEYTRLPPPLFRHGIWISGMTLNRQLMGKDGGPDSDQIKLTLNRNLDESKQFLFETAFENRDSDLYESTLSPSGQPDRVIKIEDNPTEYRWRMISGLAWEPREGLILNFRIGYEHAQNFNFVPHLSKENWMGSISVSIGPYFFRRTPSERPRARIEKGS